MCFVGSTIEEFEFENLACLTDLKFDFGCCNHADYSGYH
jgi:hypothetical protein